MKGKTSCILATLTFALALVTIALAACTSSYAPTKPSHNDQPNPSSQTQPNSVATDTTTHNDTVAFQRKEITAAALAATTLTQHQQRQTRVAATVEARTLEDIATPAFFERFDTNRNYWYTGMFSDTEMVDVVDGVLRSTWHGIGTSYEVYVEEFTNFIAEVDCAIVKGGRDGGCGLIFAHTAHHGFYEFELYTDYYRLSLYQETHDPSILLEGNPMDIFKPNGFNRMRVVRINNEIRLFVNDTLLAKGEDTTFPSGKIGIATLSHREAGGVQVEIDNFSLWRLP